MASKIDEAAVERQKLVPDDFDEQDEPATNIITQSVPKTTIQTPISPVLSNKVGKSFFFLWKHPSNGNSLFSSSRYFQVVKQVEHKILVIALDVETLILVHILLD